MKPNFKFFFFLASAVIFSISVNAQDFNPGEFRSYSRPEKYDNVNGQPYLFKDWAKGTVKTVNSTVSKDAMIKYDEIEDRIIMQGNGGELQVPSEPVLEFTITDSKLGARIFRAGFSAINNTTESSFFEILADGKIKLLRKNNKIISENKEYSGAINRTVVDGVKFYTVSSNNTPVLIKLDQKALISLLPDKESQLTEYIKANKLNLKKEEDAAKFVTYMNTL